NTRSAIDSFSPEHRIETRHPGRYPLTRCFVVQPRRGDWQNAEALVVDQERVVVRAVARAAVLDDAQSPRGELVGDAMIEQDHAVADILFEPMPRERAVAALGRDDRCHAAIFEPAEQSPQLRS